VRFEQRVCDQCGKRSDLLLTREPDAPGLVRVLSMEQRGWGLINDRDLCPDCMWMHDFEAAA